MNTIKFIKFNEQGRFDSQFKVETTNHSYYSWQGQELPDGHQLSYLSSLHLVDSEKFEPMR